MSKLKTAIDLFSGAGGLSFGFTMAGFRMVQAVDKDKATAQTYRVNHPLTDFVESPVEELEPKECLRRLGMQSGELTALIGGPPCQGFSESNRRTRTLDNPANHLYEQLLRFAR